MKIAILGVGNMGRALLDGNLETGALRPEEVRLFDLKTEAVAALAAERGATAAKSAAEAVEGAELVLLAVKPQTLEGLCAALPAPEGATYLSIAAGVPSAAIESWLGEGARVVRAMPNTPALVGAGASAICAGAKAGEEDLLRAEAVLKAVGLVRRVPEAQLDAVTGLSGSGPAYGYLMIEALADAGVAEGLPRPLAQELAAQTLLGAAKMVLDTGEHPGVLKDRVCSPAGTTIAGVAALERGGLRATLIDAVVAAAARSRALGGR